MISMFDVDYMISDLAFHNNSWLVWNKKQESQETICYSV